MKTILILLSVGGLLLTAGCFSLETTPLGDASNQSIQLHGDTEQATEHVVISNFGWYFFNC